MGFINSMIDFQGFVAVAGLLDASFTGNPFTWTNNQTGKRNIKARLHRVLLNDKWAEMDTSFTVTHLMRDPSDHSPLLLSCPQYAKGPSRFVFQNMWLDDTSFRDLVKKFWESDQTKHANAFSTLQQKLRNLKVAIKQWNKDHYGNIFEEKRKAEEAIQQAEQGFDEDPSDNNRMTLQMAQATLRRCLYREEVF